MDFIGAIVSWATHFTQTWGYVGIFVTQTLESAMIPIPSEVVVPFGGFMASLGELNIWLVVFFATLANLLGAVIAYCIGMYGGRPLLEKYGKYVLITRHDIARMDRLFERYGAYVAFVARIMPGIRTFSSLIIGGGDMRFSVFFSYTILGSLVWNSVLGYVGYMLGARWEQIAVYLREFELLIGIVLLIGILWFIYHKIKAMRVE